MVKAEKIVKVIYLSALAITVANGFEEK